MRKHCGNCANHRKETNAFSEECGKCVSARLENGETTDPSHWRALPQTNADRIRAMSDEELAHWICKKMMSCSSNVCPGADLCQSGDGLANGLVKWLKQPVED